jgi:uncharacterized protein YxjI
MKVFIKNKLISIGGGSTVLNENQEPIFNVKGKVFTFTKKKRIYDMQGNLLFTVRNRFWNSFADKVFVYDAEGSRVATIKKNRWSVNCDYEILDTADEMSIDGKFFSLQSRIKKNGQVVATISREFTLVRDAFTLEAEEKDIPFFTALVIALDNMHDKTTKTN